jgi:hypothetical protein
MVAHEEMWKGFVTKCIGVDHHTVSFQNDFSFV